MGSSGIKLKAAVFIFLFSNLTLIAQTELERDKRPGGIFLQAGGPTLIGINFDYHLNNLLDIDFGFGLNASVQLGIKYHPLGNKTNTIIFPYTGFYGELIREINIFGGDTKSTIGFYIPFGIEIYVYNGLTFSAEIAYNNTRQNFGQLNTEKVNYAFRIGYHIK